MKGGIIISESDDNFKEPPSDGMPIERVIKRWPEIEALLESSGRSTELDELVIDYLTQLKEDNTQVQWIRNITISVAVICIGFLWYYLVILIRDDWVHFFLIGQNARVAFIVGLFALTGVFLTVVLRGAFKMTKDRHKDKLPMNIQALIDGVAK